MDGAIVYWILLSFLVVSLLLSGLVEGIKYFNIKINNELVLHSVHGAIAVTAMSFLWYSISLSFTLYNKWLLQQWRGGFHFPITLTAVHMVIKALATRVWAASPAAVPVTPMSWRVFATVVVPIGVLTSADIVLSNAAIASLPLSMYTTIKGSTLIFTFAWGVLFGLERFSWRVCLAVCGICAGIGAAVASSSMDLSTVGLVCSLGSAMCGGLRWVLLQVLVELDGQPRGSGSSSVMVTLYRFAPPSVAFIVPIALAMEYSRLTRSSFVLDRAVLLDVACLAGLGGLVSLALIAVEVALLRLTSSLSMSVIGQAKEILQILLAMALFKDNLRARSALGILLSIAASYYYKHLSAAKAAAESARKTDVESGSGRVEMRLRRKRGQEGGRESAFLSGDADAEGGPTDDSDSSPLLSGPAAPTITPSSSSRSLVLLLEQSNMMPMHIQSAVES